MVQSGLASTFPSQTQAKRYMLSRKAPKSKAANRAEADGDAPRQVWKGEPPTSEQFVLFNPCRHEIRMVIDQCTFLTQHKRRRPEGDSWWSLAPLSRASKKIRLSALVQAAVVPLSPSLRFFCEVT